MALTKIESGGIGTALLTQTFRGLTLRTHPDADVAAYKVYLDHCDEMIMHDGTRVTDWDDLTADITVSGANGLDTSTEGASRWYSIHAIRNSSADTKGLLLHRAKNYLKDTSFETASDTGLYLRLATSTATDKLAQGFQVATAGVLPFVDINANKGGSPTGRVWFTIEADNAGNPSGTPLATSDKLDVSLITSTAVWIRFVFRTPPTLSAATQYHLVAQGDYTRSDVNCFSWKGVVAGGYASGSSREYNGATWAATAGANGLDRLFRVYVTENDAAVTMPSGYDQHCLIGWVYNNSGSDFVAMAAKGRVVRNYSVVISNVTATVMTFAEMTAAVPPVPIILRSGLLRSAGAGDEVYISPSISTSTLYAAYQQIPAAAYWTTTPLDVFCEYQHVYYKGTSTGLFFYLTSYEW